MIFGVYELFYRRENLTRTGSGLLEKAYIALSSLFTQNLNTGKFRIYFLYAFPVQSNTYIIFPSKDFRPSLL